MRITRTDQQQARQVAGEDVAEGTEIYVSREEILSPDSARKSKPRRAAASGAKLGAEIADHLGSMGHSDELLNVRNRGCIAHNGPEWRL